MADRELPAGARRALIRFAAAGTPRRRLICLPFAGGGPSTYRWWPRSLPADMEVLAVVLPGRDPRVRAAGGEDPPGAMAAVVPPVVEAIDELQDDSPLPFAIFGHSMGALVAFELTVALEAAHGAQRRPAPRAETACPATCSCPGGDRPTSCTGVTRSTACPTTTSSTRCSGCTGASPRWCEASPSCWPCSCRRCGPTSARSRRTRRSPTARFSAPSACTAAPTTVGLRRHSYPVGSVWLARQISLRTFPGDHFYLNDHRDDLAADIASRWTVMGRWRTPPKRSPPSRSPSSASVAASPARPPARTLCGGCSTSRSTRSARSPPTVSTSPRCTTPARPRPAGS